MKNVSLKLPVLLALALLFPGQVHSQKDILTQLRHLARRSKKV